MNKKILSYQKAFNSILDKINKSNNILAIMVFGSALTGDLWEGSDIDMLAVVDDTLKNRRNIYITENNITVHIRIIEKKQFLEFNRNNLRGGKLHRILISSRLIFSKDSEITNTFNSFKYYPEKDKEKWNLVYLSLLLKSIAVCKKYLRNKRVYTAYENAVNIIEDFSVLFLNYNGYLVSKDATALAIELNDRFKEKVDKLIYSSKDECFENINEIINYVECYINENLKSISKILLDFLEGYNQELSVEEIENHEYFKEFSMSLQDVMELLHKNNFVKKSEREIIIVDDKTQIKENVYGYM